MEDLENRAISSFTTNPEIFIRYIDDIFFVWPHSECDISEFYDAHLNIQDNSTEFTVELEKDGKIPFLDVLVSRMYCNRGI
jgi:hypothetical protein